MFASALVVGSLLLSPGSMSKYGAADPAPPRRVSREPGWRCMEVWRQPQGLPQNTVYSILQTRDGYVWIGTKGGAARFDGVRFTAFDDTRPDQLKENEVWSLLEAPDGALWMATYGGGAVRYKDGAFTTFGTKDGLLSDYTAALAVGPDGGIWVGSDGGVSVLKDGHVTNYTVKDGLAQKGVRSFYLERDGTMWIGALRGGLNRYKDGKIAAEPIPEIGHNAEIRRFCRDREQNLWIATTEGVIRVKDGRSTLYTTREGLSSDRVYSVHEDPQGRLWFGTDKGLDRWRDGAFVPMSIGNEVSTVEQIVSVASDHEGSLWVGSLRDGLARLKEGLFVSYTAREGLADNYASTVMQDRQGRIWVGTAKGLNRLIDGTLETFTIPGVSNRINSLAEDPAGRLWVGTNDGIYRVEATPGCTGPACAPRFVSVMPREPSAIFVRVILAEADGTVWVGTNLEGLLQYREGQWTTYTTANGLSDNAIRGLVRDREGSLWIGTRGGGLCRMKDGAFRVYKMADGLVNDNVQSLYLDDDGVLWVSTRQGVSRYKDGRFKSYTVADGLFTNYVYAFVDDGAGNLWMSCSKGIFRVPKKELADFAEGRSPRFASSAYGIEHGLATTVATISHYPSGFRTKDGGVWFTTFKGVTVVDPQRLSANALPPPVHIEEVSVDGAAWDTRRTTTVPPGRGDITFRFTGLSFLAPEKMRFRYRLSGYDPDWVDSGTRRVAYYTNIPPGGYTFQVAASNNDGVWNETGASVALFLKPHFYQTWTFYLLCALAAATAGAGTQRLRVSYLKARQKELTARVTEMVAQMKVINGLLPICASCKKIRDDGGYWNQIETYISTHSQAEFSHSICPDCTAKLYPDYQADLDKRVKPPDDARN